MKRPTSAPSNGVPSIAISQESKVLAPFPLLSDLVLTANWDDQTAKGKRCLMVFIDDQATRLLVKLEGDCLKFSTVAHSLDEALAVAEKLLVTGQVVWEQDSPPAGRPPKKRK